MWSQLASVNMPPPRGRWAIRRRIGMRHMQRLQVTSGCLPTVPGACQRVRKTHKHDRLVLLLSFDRQCFETPPQSQGVDELGKYICSENCVDWAKEACGASPQPTDSGTKRTKSVSALASRSFPKEHHYHTQALFEDVRSERVATWRNRRSVDASTSACCHESRVWKGSTTLDDIKINVIIHSYHHPW